jgi:hypothetical protein
LLFPTPCLSQKTTVLKFIWLGLWSAGLLDILIGQECTASPIAILSGLAPSEQSTRIDKLCDILENLGCNDKY